MERRLNLLKNKTQCKSPSKPIKLSAQQKDKKEETPSILNRIQNQNNNNNSNNSKLTSSYNLHSRTSLYKKEKNIKNNSIIHPIPVTSNTTILNPPPDQNLKIINNNNEQTLNLSDSMSTNNSETFLTKDNSQRTTILQHKNQKEINRSHNHTSQFSQSLHKQMKLGQDNRPMSTGYYIPNAFTKFSSPVYKNAMDSNINLYKNEKKYKMDKYLRFESSNEENRSNEQYEKRTIIYFLIIELIQIYQLYITNKNFNSVIIKKIYIPSTIFLTILTFIFFSKTISVFLGLKRIERLLCKTLLCISQLNYIYFSIRFSVQSTESITYLHIILLLSNLLFDFPLDHTILLSIIDFIIILIGYYQRYNTLLSKPVLKELLIHLQKTVVLVIVDYFCRKAKREMWVLYDSFKCSYNYLNNALMSGIELPIFVISKMKNIYYYNKAGQKFCNDMLNINMFKNNCFAHNEVNSITDFNDLLIDEQLFDKLLVKTITNDNSIYFLYPFIPKDNPDKNLTKFDKTESMLVSTEISGLKWYQIIISPCIWKNNECFYMQLFPYDDMQFHDFFSDKLNNLSQNLEILISELDNSCRDLQVKNLINKPTSKINEILYRENFFFRDKSLTEALNPYQIIDSLTKNMMPPYTYRSRAKKNFIINQLFKNPFIVNYEYFDYSMWFLLSNKTSKLYNIFSTLQIFGMYFLHHIYNEYKNVKLDELVSSISELFYTDCQANGFSIDFSVKGEHEINLNIEFLNCIMINLISFIIYNYKNNNLSSGKEKKINFMIEVITKKEYLEHNPSRKKEKEKSKNEILRTKTSINNIHDYINTTKLQNEFENIIITSSFNDNILIRDDDLIIKISIDFADSKSIYNLMTANGRLFESVNGSIDKEMDKLEEIPLGIYVANYIVSFIYYNKIDYDSEFQQIYFYALGKKVNREEDTTILTKSIEKNIDKYNYKSNIKCPHFSNSSVNLKLIDSPEGLTMIKNISDSKYKGENIHKTSTQNFPKNKSTSKPTFYNFYIKENYEINQIYYNRICEYVYKVKINDNIVIYNPFKGVSKQMQTESKETKFNILSKIGENIDSSGFILGSHLTKKKKISSNQLHELTEFSLKRGSQDNLFNKKSRHKIVPNSFIGLDNNEFLLLRKNTTTYPAQFIKENIKKDHFNISEKNNKQNKNILNLQTRVNKNEGSKDKKIITDFSDILINDEGDKGTYRKILYFQEGEDKSTEEFHNYMSLLKSNLPKNYDCSIEYSKGKIKDLINLVNNNTNKWYIIIFIESKDDYFCKEDKFIDMKYKKEKNTIFIKISNSGGSDIKNSFYHDSLVDKNFVSFITEDIFNKIKFSNDGNSIIYLK